MFLSLFFQQLLFHFRLVQHLRNKSTDATVLKQSCDSKQLDGANIRYNKQLVLTELFHKENTVISVVTPSN